MYSSDCKLPGNLLDYRSQESHIRLVRCLTNGTASTFLSLSSCYKTQSSTAYCGLATLAIALNSLQIDPSRVWKTKERWYTEHLLGTCRPLDLVEEIGIPMEVFRCLALQNEADCEMTRPSDDNKDYIQFQKAVSFSCVTDHSDKIIKTDIHQPENHESIICVAYDRYTLGMQGLSPGKGHYSPIAAYDKETESVLILDVARYKYPPHWVPVQLLFRAMLPVDPETGKSRGYFIMSRRKANKEICLSQDCDCFHKR